MKFNALKLISLSILLVSIGSYSSKSFTSSNSNLTAGPNATTMAFDNLTNDMPSISPDKGTLSTNVTFVDNQNNVWIGTSNGLYLKPNANNSIVEQEGEQNALLGKAVNSIGQSADGTMWFGIAGGQIWYALPSALNTIKQLTPSVTGNNFVSTGVWNANLIDNNNGEYFLTAQNLYVTYKNASGDYKIDTISAASLNGIPATGITFNTILTSRTATTPSTWAIWIGTTTGMYVRTSSTSSFSLVSSIAANTNITSIVAGQGTDVVAGGILSSSVSSIFSATDVNNAQTAFTTTNLMYPDGQTVLNTMGATVGKVVLGSDTNNDRLFVGTNQWQTGAQQNRSSLFVDLNTKKSSYTNIQEVNLNTPTNSDYSQWYFNTSINSIGMNSKGNPCFGSLSTNAFWKYSEPVAAASGLNAGAIFGIVLGALSAAGVLTYMGYKKFHKVKNKMQAKKASK